MFDELDHDRLLVHSLCPSIYGHELVKAALLMALFGGLVRGEDGIVSEEQQQQQHPPFFV